MNDRLFSAEVVAGIAPPPKPPKRGDWYMLLYVSRSGYWVFAKTGKTVDVWNVECAAREKAANRGLVTYRVVRIPGEP